MLFSGITCRMVTEWLHLTAITSFHATKCCHLVSENEATMKQHLSYVCTHIWQKDNKKQQILTKLWIVGRGTLCEVVNSCLYVCLIEISCWVCDCSINGVIVFRVQGRSSRESKRGILQPGILVCVCLQRWISTTCHAPYHDITLPCTQNKS